MFASTLQKDNEEKRKIVYVDSKRIPIVNKLTLDSMFFVILEFLLLNIGSKIIVLYFIVRLHNNNIIAFSVK